MCAVRDVDGSLRIHSDVIAKCVSSRQRDAALSIPCPKIKSLQRASGIAALCRCAQCTQVVRASPERVRSLICENSQNRARTQSAWLDKNRVFVRVWFDTDDPTISETADIERAVRP